jgi:Ca-activated chloride channel family protein
MSFANPIALLALLLVPLALAAHVAARRRATRYAIRFPAAATLAAAIGTVPAWRRHLPAALALSALAALAPAFAKPQRTVAVPIEGSSVMLVTDHSGSMSATDVEPNRLQATIEAAKSFLSSTPRQTRVGIVTYSDAPDGTQAPTTDRAPVRQALQSQVAVGATATGSALQVALDTLTRERRAGKRPPAAIVLLSDGRTTTGIDPVEVARKAKRLGIPISTVALGTNDATIPNPVDPMGAPIGVPPDPETLRQIARVSGGRAFTTGDAEKLTSIYQSLGSTLATRKEHREITVGFAAAGLVLLLGAGIASVRGSGPLP